MAWDYTATPLYKFCKEEAEYRVNEWVHSDNLRTLADELGEKGVDVKEFTNKYTSMLFDQSERWINGDKIAQMLDELIGDYDLGKEI